MKLINKSEMVDNIINDINYFFKRMNADEVRNDSMLFSINYNKFMYAIDLAENFGIITTEQWVYLRHSADAI